MGTNCDYYTHKKPWWFFFVYLESTLPRIKSLWALLKHNCLPPQALLFFCKAGHPFFFMWYPEGIERLPTKYHKILFFFFFKLPAVFMPCKALRGGLYQIRTYAWLHLTGPLFQQNQPSRALPYIKSKTIYMHASEQYHI